MIRRNVQQRTFKKLSNVEHVRMRTGMWLGQNSVSTYMQHFIEVGEDGLYCITHREVSEVPAVLKCLDEACMNAVDEFHRNRRDKSIRLKDKMNFLEVQLSIDGRQVTVCDNGRGIPVENAENVFLHLMYGENFDDQAQQEHISGQNGVGISLVRIVSKHFRVRTHHEKKTYQKVFTVSAPFQAFLQEELKLGPTAIKRVVQYFDEHGHLNQLRSLSSGQIKQCNKQMSKMHMVNKVDVNPHKKHGTLVEYELDPKYFGDLDVSYKPEIIQQYLQDLAMVNPGLTIRFRHQQTTKTFFFKKGLEEVLCSSKYVHYKLRYENKETHLLFELYFLQGSGTSLNWVNGNFVGLGGSSIEYLENRLCDEVRKKNAVLMLEKRLKTQATRKDVRNCFHMINTFFIIGPRFKSQDKSYLINDLNEDIRKAIDLHLDRLIRKIDLINAVKDQMQQRTMLKSMVNSFKSLKKSGKRSIPKLIDISHSPTSSKEKNDSILFIAEGDSAIAGLRPVRDPTKHALFPLKGKPMNIKGIPIYKAMENEEIKNIIAALELPINKDTPVRSPQELRYSKVSIITDADYDGYAIRSLIFSFFLEYWPELYDLGVIHMSEAPLYEIEIENPQKQKKIFFCIDDNEVEALMQKVKQSHSKVLRKKRNKGLGETSRLAMSHTIHHCMCQLKIKNRSQTIETQNLWFHKEYAPHRRKAISEYSQLFFED